VLQQIEIDQLLPPGIEGELQRRLKRGGFKPMPNDFFKRLRHKQHARFKAARQRRAA
jgi:hypothetical protein